MGDRVVSERMAKKEGKYKLYKGKPAFKWDRYLKWILKMILQVIIFSLIYFFNIELIRQEYNNNPVMEFFAIMGWMVFTDFFVAIGVMVLKSLFLYYLKYVSSDKKNNNSGLWLWEYIIYTGLRAFCYVILLTNLLITMYARVMPELFAIILAWISISLGSRIIARASAIGITMR